MGVAIVSQRWQAQERARRTDRLHGIWKAPVAGAEWSAAHIDVTGRRSERARRRTARRAGLPDRLIRLLQKHFGRDDFRVRPFCEISPSTVSPTTRYAR